MNAMLIFANLLITLLQSSDNNDPKYISLFIKESRLKEHVEYLASDALEGRLSGTEGEYRATDYIANVFKEAGLKPAGDDDEKGNRTFFQYVQIKEEDNKFLKVYKSRLKKARNCVGLLEGSNPVLKKEVIVIGAHHDHLGHAKKYVGFPGRFTTEKRGRVDPFGMITSLGLSDRSDNIKRTVEFGLPSAPLGFEDDFNESAPHDPNDFIFNGADDNASGVGTLLTIVEALGKAKTRFKRSILFITFCAEEWGLAGSWHYATNPCTDITRHMGMINLDMIGANPGKPVYFMGLGVDSNGYYKKVVTESAKDAGLNFEVKESGLTSGSSDHSTFIKFRVPSITLFSGSHRLYHTPADHSDKLDFQRMYRTALCLVRVIQQLAEKPEKPKFNDDYKDSADEIAPQFTDAYIELIKLKFEEFGMELSPIGGKSQKKLGLLGNEGGFKITKIESKSLAEVSGLKKGDHIIAVDGNKLQIPRNVEALQEQVSLFLNNSKPLLLVRRGRQEMEVRLLDRDNIY